MTHECFRLHVVCSVCGTLSSWNVRQEDRAEVMKARHLKRHKDDPGHHVTLVVES